MDSVKDSINNFLDKYIFTREIESEIGQYGNDVVDLINKFIRIIIAFAIVYLIIIKLPDHGDKDHTMYFNLLLLISIFLILIYIQKNWREYYISKFLGDNGYGGGCAQDQDNPPKTDSAGNICPVGLEKNGSLLIDSITTGLLDEFKEWTNYLKLIGLGILLRQMGYKWYYAFIIFIPVDSIEGVIYYLLYGSKYSPINFLFGKTGSIEDPYIYEDNKISDGKQLESEQELKNFNERFYVMYIVLILLIFFTIIIRLTSDTIIDCKNFVGPIPTDYLQGCMGYRFYMILNVLLFIGFSTDFMDSLQKISVEKDILKCPWRLDESGNQLPVSQQVYTSREGECLKPEDLITTPQDCEVTQELLECKDDRTSDLPDCLIKRTDYNNYSYTLKDIVQFNEEKNSSDKRIIIAKNPDGNYMIHPSNEIEIKDPNCLKSINRWLSSQNKDSMFEPLPKSIIDSMLDISDDIKDELLKAIGLSNDDDSNSNNSR